MAREWVHLSGLRSVEVHATNLLAKVRGLGMGLLAKVHGSGVDMP